MFFVFCFCLFGRCYEYCEGACISRVIYKDRGLWLFFFFCFAALKSFWNAQTAGEAIEQDIYFSRESRGPLQLGLERTYSKPPWPFLPNDSTLPSEAFRMPINFRFWKRFVFTMGRLSQKKQQWSWELFHHDPQLHISIQSIIGWILPPQPTMPSSPPGLWN